MSRYVGFYWTLPVPWAGFTSLPKDPKAAAQASRTIAYQRERVRRWVKDEGGTLVHEEAFLELAPDRGSEHILPIVDKLLTRCRAERARLVMVEFWDAYGWRRHGPLAQRLEANVGLCILLNPVTLTSAEGHFDPVEHFRTWREVEGVHAAGKAGRRVELAHAIAQRQGDQLSFKELAEALNAYALTTPTGKPWTPESLRKFLKGLWGRAGVGPPKPSPAGLHLPLGRSEQPTH